MFRSNSSSDGNTPEKFLKLTKKCLDLVEGRRWMVPSAMVPNATFTPYIYNGQCKYLVDKLRDAVESAQTFLILFNKGSPSSKASLNCLEVFKLLYDLSNVVKHFIRSCCQHAWVQTAICLSDVVEHITSLGFNLEIMRLTFLKRLHLSMIDVVYEVEVEIVTKKAISDRELLLKEVRALLETQKSTSPYYQLTTCIYERLGVSMDLAPSQIGLSKSHCVDEKCLKQMGQLGKGSFAIVHKALWLGIEVAKKTFLSRSSPEFEKEVSFLLRLSHPNIMSLIGYAQGNRECSIIMELMDEDLLTLIQRRMKENNGRCPPFGIHEAIDIMLQIGGGMRYLRERRIVHRDLKSMNILVKHMKIEGSRGYVLVKVSDFGLSKTKERSLTFSNQTPNVGTTRWMAPELIKLRTTVEQSEVSKIDAKIAKHPYSSDVYSFAMVCYEILTGEIPYFEDLASVVKEKVLKGDRPELPDQYPLELKSLIEQCWSRDPSKRPSFVEICVELRRLKCLFLAQLIAAQENLEENLGHVKHFTINQLRNATKNFNIKNKLVSRYGEVYKGVLSDGTLLAVKRFKGNHSFQNDGTVLAVKRFKVNHNFQSDQEFQIEVEFQAEVEVISMVANRHLLSLYGFCTTPSECFLAYPYMPNGSVASHFKTEPVYGETGELTLSSGTRKHIAVGAAKGLVYLHEQCSPKILHGDVKAENILLDDEFEAIVCNFNFIMPVDFKDTHITPYVSGTMGHIAPEFQAFGELSEKADVYSFGITLLQLITGQVSVKGSCLYDDKEMMLLDWVKRLVKDDKVKLMVDPFLKEYDMNDIEELLRVALLCTQNSPAARPRMSEVVSMLEGTGLEERWAEWEKLEVISYEEALGHASSSS